MYLISDLIGRENTKKLMKEFGGSSIYIPREDRVSRNKRIIKEYNGYNSRALAKKYDLCHKTIQKIVKEG
ncbi:Mor transcription activator family protein [Anaerophilus nitritogenes]|uniref:Mor transcription activator family protein n=1 Tax=Anaerophilus nitritogenes TaxID=2498136 RepID=UPI001FAAF916|nr:Mor transcription activator family protein [Anaerophilus nitritogenes]